MSIEDIPNAILYPLIVAFIAFIGKIIYDVVVKFGKSFYIYFRDLFEFKYREINKYRAKLKDETNWIEIRGIGAGHSTKANRAPLLDIYINLNVKQKTTNSRPMPLAQVISSAKKIAIIGTAGAGKTMFLKYIARTYIENRKKPLPVLIQLPELFTFGFEDSSEPFIGPEVIIRYCISKSKAMKIQLENKWFNKKLENGKIIFLLDSFDELPHKVAREKMKSLIQDAVAEWGQCTWVITSRPSLFYGDFIPNDFSETHIAALEDGEIEAFIKAWYKILKNTSPEDSYKFDDPDELIQNIKDNQEMKLLARTPVMLTCIAVVHWNEKKLPQGRTLLYNAVIRWLIESRKKIFDDIKLPSESIKRIFQKLAFKMFLHPDGRKTQVTIKWAAQILKDDLANFQEFKEFDQEARILRIKELIKKSVWSIGLLDFRGIDNSEITFRHNTFQEFLAASEIAGKPNDDQWKILGDKFQNPAWTDMLIPFFIVLLVRSGAGHADTFMNTLFDSYLDRPLEEKLRLLKIFKDKNVFLELALWGYQIHNLEKSKEFLKETIDILTNNALDIDIQLRYDAAVAIGRIGDPRLDEPNKNWIQLPGGELRIGAQNEDKKKPNYDQFAESEKTPVQRFFTGPFEIGKYPITVKEYIHFIDKDGYRNNEFWDDKGRQWKDKYKIMSPNNLDSQKRFSNRPVVDVSWHEAKAYCKWLNKLDKNNIYRLPTESEWEYTARRGDKLYKRFCFGDIPPDDIKVEINCQNNQNFDYALRKLAPVGIFPLDRSFDKVMDMNGNIKEWTLSSPYAESNDIKSAGNIDSKKPDLSILKAESWDYDANFFGTAARESVVPEIRHYHVGFRVLREAIQVAIKGRLPYREYNYTLNDIFATYQNKCFSNQEAAQKLKSIRDQIPSDHNVTIDIINTLFPNGIFFKDTEFKRYPYRVGDAPHNKLEYNLRYQDTALKLAIEDKMANTKSEINYEQDSLYLMSAIAIILNTSGIKRDKLWQDMTDNDYDALIYHILNIYDDKREIRMEMIGHKTNEKALSSLPDCTHLPFEELVSYQIFAGIVWWDQCEASFEEQFLMERNFKINDIELLKNDLSGSDKHLLFIFDDNGELAWDLSFIQRILHDNPTWKVTGIVSLHSKANNSNIVTLEECLKHSKLHQLKVSASFETHIENFYRSSLELELFSNELRNLFKHADLAFVKGSMNFETLQNLPVDTYYAFVSHGADSPQYTGIEEGLGILARIPKNEAGYICTEDDNVTLCDVYTKLKLKIH